MEGEIKMKIEFIDVKYNKEIKLPADAVKKLVKYKQIAVYSSVQFINNLPSIIKQLKDAKVDVITSTPDRTSCKGQLLGCDVYPGNLNLPSDVDAVLFIGDGDFHALALLHSGIKEVISYNPISNKLKIYGKEDIDKVLKKKQANVKRFYASDVVGIIISTKFGQEHFHYVDKLKSKFSDKRFYVFVCDNVDFRELENFPFIQSWVNTACPRIGLEDVLNTNKAIVNVCDVLYLYLKNYN